MQLFDPTAWEPFTNWSVWRFLFGGLATTAALAGCVLAIGLVIACGAALARISVHKWLAVPVEVVVTVLRSLPVLLILLAVFFLLPLIGLGLPPFPSALVALSAYMAAVLSDVLVAGLRAVPRGQWEAPAALGFSPGKRMLLIIGPQVIRSMAPGIVNVLITAVKDTALASILTVDELLGRANQVQAIYLNPLQVYIVAGLIYLLLNLALGQVGHRIETSPWMRRRRVTETVTEEPAPTPT
jgi:glutamate transport system permease protein